MLPRAILLIFAVTGFLATARAEPAAGSVESRCPDWAKSAVWYQIFPERFRNGDPGNDPTRDSLEWPIGPGANWRLSRWTADWYARDEWETELSPNFYKGGVFDRRYGGDLQGVLDKLDYLAELGVNALYFNPVFYARSLHKYDGSSFHHIDPFFGPDPRGDLALIDGESRDPATWKWTAADKLFLQLVKQAHARGMRVIIDGVFNHTGRDFFAFKDLTRKQAASSYKDWYVVNTFDDPATKRNEFHYEGWWGHKSLPVFSATPDGRNMPAGPKKYIWDATRRWMDPNGDGDPGDGIDGWRLDVADERPAQFWADWNTYVRKLNPQAYTSAEVWKDAKALIVEGGFSASMNYYGFAIPVKGCLVDHQIPMSKFVKLLDDRRNALPRPVAYTMQNLMDSHDTDRLASMIVNGERTRYASADQIDYNTNNDLRDAPNYEVRAPTPRERDIQKLVALFQMTYVGAPMLYYGTEAGMWGAHDPDNRLPMVWPDLQFDPQGADPRPGKSRPPDPVAFDQALFDFHKRVVALRRQHPVLDRGDFAWRAVNDEADTVAFERSSGDARIVVVLNRSEQVRSVALTGFAPEAKLEPIFSTATDALADEPAPSFADGKWQIKIAPLSGRAFAVKR